MRKFLITAIAVSSLALWGAAVRAEDKAKDDKKEKDKGWHGILIDTACSGKMKTDADAAKHTKKCAMAEGCAKSGYGLFHDDKFIKFDDKGSEKAKEYLKEEKNGLKIHVTGKLSDDKKTLTVDEIHADKEKKDDKKKES